jgi:hypothetical protein
MLASQKLAIAAHLHVLLRRKTGRVTDTEWMAQNLEYAAEVVRFSRAKAAEDGHPELGEWADKLEQAIATGTPSAPRPLAETAMQLLRDKPIAAAPADLAERGRADADRRGDSGFFDSALEAARRKTNEAPAPQYVGGIR